MNNMRTSFESVKDHPQDEPVRSVKPGRFFGRFTPEYEYELQQIRKIDKIVNERLSAFISAEP